MSNSPIRVLIHGASGRMGSALLRLAALDPRVLVVAAASRSGVAAAGSKVRCIAVDDLAVSPAFDVAVDFSLPEALDPLLSLCLDRRAALLTGTTGLSPMQFARLTAAGERIPVLWASNFSLGVVVLEDVVRRASAALRHWDLRIVETHHVRKKDAPSGTALSLARAAQGAGGALPEIESIREGEVVGDHLVRFAGPGETLEFRHQATDRDIFAAGALEAATLLVRRAPGLHHLGDLLFA